MPARPGRRPLPWRLVALATLFGLAGCGRTMSEDDCAKIAARMREVWASETKSAGEGEAGSEKASAVVKSEGDKLVADWTAECKKDLVGRRVDPKELSCLLEADSVAAMNTCAGL